MKYEREKQKGTLQIDKVMLLIPLKPIYETQIPSNCIAGLI